MDISRDISQLKDTPEEDKHELYRKIIKNIEDIYKRNESVLSEQDIGILCQEIQNDLAKKSLCSMILGLLEFLLKKDETIKPILSDAQKLDFAKGVILAMDSSQDDKTLTSCFTCLDDVLTTIKLEDGMLEDLFGRIADIISKKTIPVPLYMAACSCIQRLLKEYEDGISKFMHIVPKIIFLPLSHNSAKIREIAEKTLDNFPKLVLSAENETASSVLIKVLKESYCKELISLFKEKQELYVLKVWNQIVNALGKNLHRNLPAVTPFFQVIEKGFKSTDDTVCKTAFVYWKSLISNFALDAAVLNDSKKLKFVLKPIRNLTKNSECVSLAVCDTWWYIAWSLNHNLSARFSEVLLPLLEFTLGKITSGPHERAVSKGSQIFLAKRGCHFLLRILEQPPNNSLNRISSPKKIPPIMFPALQNPLDIKVIIHHAKEIMSMIRVVIEIFGSIRDMTGHVDCLLKSVLFVVSAVVEDKSKDSVEAVIAFINLVSDITEAQMCPPLTCLKCIDSLSKLPRSTLISHCFHCGARKPQDILCTSLLKLLLNPYLFSTERSNKRFLMAYNRLIQAGLGESLNSLLMAQKFINIVKHVTSQGVDVEILFEMWSGIASPLLDTIEKTQEVNQGNKQEHDFSCLYDILLLPFENIFPVSVNQLRIKPAFRLWTNLYKTFVRCASLVPTTLPNEVCEHFCAGLKNHFKDELLKEPQYFETVCFLLQVILDSIDFTSTSATGTPGFSSILMKKKKPLGNLTSFVDLLSVLLTSFYANYIDQEDDIYQSCTPKAQRKGNVSKSAIPLDLVKTFFGNLKVGSLISCALEELAQPLSKLFAVSQKKTHTSVIGAKLEVLWDVFTSAIEMHYLGPYDTDFLTTICPLLESSFSHPRRHIKERSRRFWFATFAPVASSLILPDSLKNILKKSKLSLLPDENVSSIEDSSFNPVSDSMEDEIISFEKAPDTKEFFVKPFAVSKVKEPKPAIKETESKSTKESKTSIKKSVDELPSSEFVKIDSPNPSSLTPRRRSIRQRKSFVPAMYNDLSQSQDTTTLGGSSESFDTSSSCEIMEFNSQEKSDMLPTSCKEANADKDKKEAFTVSEDVSKPCEATSSIEVLSSEINIAPDNNATPSSEEIVILESGDVFEKQVNFPVVPSLKELSTSCSENTKIISESSDVIIVTSSEDVNVQETIIESENSEDGVEKNMAEGDFGSNPDQMPISNEVGGKRSLRARSKKISPTDEMQNSQEVTKTENLVSSKSTSKKTDSISEKKCEISNNGKSHSNIKESQESFQKHGNKKSKSTSDSASTNRALLKKNGKSKQGTITDHLKKVTAKTESKKSLPCNTKKVLSESLSVEYGATKLSDQSVISKASQSCIEIVELSDSEDIIPSSQSSGESMSYVKLPTTQKSPKNTSVPRRILTFDSQNDEDETPAASLPKDVTSESLKPASPTAEDSNECPDTPMDKIETIPKDITVTEVFSQGSAFITKAATAMPLKSSENLVIPDDHLSKLDNKGIKSALSDVLLKANEEKKMFIAENAPPLYTETFSVQTSEPVLMLDNLTTLGVEDNTKPKVDSKLTDGDKLASVIENVFNEESPKTVRVKSLRSAGKSMARKSLNSITSKKTVKKTTKRKSMPGLHLSEKSNKLDDIVENTAEEVVSDSDLFVSSSESEKISESSPQSEEVCPFPVSSTSCDTKAANEKSASISDLHESLETVKVDAAETVAQEILPDSVNLVASDDDDKLFESCSGSEKASQELDLPSVCTSKVDDPKKKPAKRKRMSDLHSSAKISKIDVLMENEEVVLTDSNHLVSMEENTKSSKKYSQSVEDSQEEISSIPSLTTNDTEEKPPKHNCSPDASEKNPKLDVNIKNMAAEVLHNSDCLASSDDSNHLSEFSSQLKKESQEIFCHPPVSNDEVEQNSILEDITNVISDLHKKIESYNEDYSCEFSCNGNTEVIINKNSQTSSGEINMDDKVSSEQKELTEKNIESSVDISDDDHNSEVVSNNIELNPSNNSDIMSQELNSDNTLPVVPEGPKKLETKITESNLGTNDCSDIPEKSSENNRDSPVSSMLKTCDDGEKNISNNDSNIITSVPSTPVVQKLAEGHQSSEVNETEKLTINVSEDGIDVENLECKMDPKSKSESNLLIMDNCTQGPKSEAKESLKNEVENDIEVSKTVESHGITNELTICETVHDSQNKAFDVVKEAKYVGDSTSLDRSIRFVEGHEDIKGFSGEILESNSSLGDSLNQINSEIAEEEINQNISKEKKNIEILDGGNEVSSSEDDESNNLKSLECTEQIDKDIQDACSEEIEETCEVANNHHGMKSEETQNPGISSLVNPEDNDFDENVASKDEDVCVDVDMNDIFSQVNVGSEIRGSAHNKTEEKGENVHSSCDETSSVVIPKPKIESQDHKITMIIGLNTDSSEYESLPHCNNTNFHETLQVDNSENKSVKVEDPCLSEVSSGASRTNPIQDFTNKGIENSSRKRKAKCPVRSPFNFRQRSNVLVSMSKSLSKDNEENSKNSKRPIQGIQKKPTEDNGKRMKKSLDSNMPSELTIKVEPDDNISLTPNTSVSSHEATNTNIGIKKAIESAKRLKVIINCDEITNVNTRFNASIAPQTRRLKMLASVHKSLPIDDDIHSYVENDVMSVEDEIPSTQSSTSILKKRKASSDLIHPKHRKVTFADPLVEERLFRSDDDLNARILKVSAQLIKPEQQISNSLQDSEKVTEANIPPTEEIPSSSEYQNSDNLTNYCDIPISPLLVNCHETVSAIVRDLTTPTWVRGLTALLFSKNIVTIGDLCKLNIHELKALPLKSPKVVTLHKALAAFLERTHAGTMEKLKSVDDWCSTLIASDSKSAESEDDITQESGNIDVNVGPEILENVAQELLNHDRIGQLSKQTLVELSKICFQEMTKRLEDH